MNLYEINEQIAGLVNEDGEIADIEQFEALSLARDTKIENIGLWVKNLEAEATAIEAEEKALEKRRKTAENNANRLRGYISKFLNGDKFTSPRICISYRKSTAVEFAVDEPDFIEWAAVKHPDLLKTTVAVDKAAIKEAIKGGEQIDFVRLAERQNMQIK
jgi:hypothetical protein